MTSSEGLVDRSLAELARAVASPDPVPGSGSVAAAVGALGAGLASMALGAGRGEGRPADSARELALRMEELLARVDRDAEAYTGYRAACDRRGDARAALERAIAVPQETAEHALRALEGLLAASGSVRPALACEAFTAVQVLLAAVESATATAGANLSALADERARTERRTALAALRERASACARSARTLVDPFE